MSKPQSKDSANNADADTGSTKSVFPKRFVFIIDNSTEERKRHECMLSESTAVDGSGRMSMLPTLASSCNSPGEEKKGLLLAVKTPLMPRKL
jgi:hypothetical protein